MVPVISVVGKSNSGKTTFIERIIPKLKEKGYRVGTIKHDAHSFDMDHEGKDTWRMRAAGTDTVVISSKSKLAMIKNVEHEKNIDEIVQMIFEDVDIVLTEGYKTQNKPKIEIVRFNEIIASPEEKLMAVVDNTAEGTTFQLPCGYETVMCFEMEDIDKVVAFIEEKFLTIQNDKVVQPLKNAL